MVSSPQPKKLRTSIESSILPASQFQVKLLNEKAQVPKRGSLLAAGYDIFRYGLSWKSNMALSIPYFNTRFNHFSSSQEITIPKGGRAAVETGVSIKVPSGTYGRVAPRSGLTFKHGIDTGAGVIDEDYTGEVKVILFNHGDSDFVINIGDRIAQLILEKIMTPEPILVEELNATSRGENGFGSTGTN
ncbi:Deoxyuridine 5'-triphosphate nucleotidohydrolase [Entomophthora muscae]|uniref:Deoxyuridine 5'-triphosphate nucleotidohydrolase n=1 Tax=Entomophthora muscae TaxID=34485 RepID=A0ACC2UE12_9FUNG|nr:Deoxyuridine 5'-triphosphate nucleotidohydrolase [Entomophthora muscae]